MTLVGEGVLESILPEGGVLGREEARRALLALMLLARNEVKLAERDFL
jgi:hypothetical protein